MSLKYLRLVADIENYFREQKYDIARLQVPYKLKVQKRRVHERSIKSFIDTKTTSYIDIIPLKEDNSVIIRVITKNSINRHIHVNLDTCSSEYCIDNETLKLLKNIIEIKSKQIIT